MSYTDQLSSCRWIVFDVTGTLLTPEPSAAAVYRQVASQHGCAIDLPTVQQRFRDALKRHFAAVIDSADAVTPPAAGRGAADQDGGEGVERTRWQRIVADTLMELNDRQVAEAFQELWSHFADPQHWRLVAGVDRLVGRLLSANRELAIATNLDRRVHRLLDAHRPLNRIRRRFLSSEIGWAKPDRRFYDHVATALGVPPEQILMVGDDPVNDLDGSRRAGWQAVAIEQLLS